MYPETSHISQIKPVFRPIGSQIFPLPTLEVIHHYESESTFSANHHSPSLYLVDPDSDPYFEPQPTSLSALPAPQDWSLKFTQSALEVLAGRRSVTQLIKWSNRPVYAHLQRRAGLLSGNPRVRKSHICIPTDGVVEASITFSLRERIRAVALRLEGLDGRWLTTSFIVG